LIRVDYARKFGWLVRDRAHGGRHQPRQINEPNAKIARQRAWAEATGIAASSVSSG